MRKVLTIAAVAAGAAAFSAAPAMADHGVDAGDLSLANIDASDAAQWQICGQNVLAQPGGQDCDNSGNGSDSGTSAGSLSLANANASDAAHWQICGQEIGSQLPVKQVGVPCATSQASLHCPHIVSVFSATSQPLRTSPSQSP